MKRNLEHNVFVTDMDLVAAVDIESTDKPILVSFCGDSSTENITSDSRQHHGMFFTFWYIFNQSINSVQFTYPRPTVRENVTAQLLNATEAWRKLLY